MHTRKLYSNTRTRTHIHTCILWNEQIFSHMVLFYSSNVLFLSRHHCSLLVATGFIFSVFFRLRNVFCCCWSIRRTRWRNRKRILLALLLLYWFCYNFFLCIVRFCNTRESGKRERASSNKSKITQTNTQIVIKWKRAELIDKLKLQHAHSHIEKVRLERISNSACMREKKNEMAWSVESAKSYWMSEKATQCSYTLIVVQEKKTRTTLQCVTKYTIVCLVKWNGWVAKEAQTQKQQIYNEFEHTYRHSLIHTSARERAYEAILISVITLYTQCI